jgi:hypothetical protein
MANHLFTIIAAATGFRCYGFVVNPLLTDPNNAMIGSRDLATNACPLMIGLPEYHYWKERKLLYLQKNQFLTF